MERALDRLFSACGALAAAFLVGICVLVLAQIVARLLGTVLPSADEFAGYCLSASSFLALGYALRHSSHIRVTLILDRLPPVRRRVAEIVCVAIGLGLSLYLTYYVAEMVYFSMTFGDVTQGLVPIPLWIPQTGMLVGIGLLSLAFMVDAVRVLRGKEPSYMVAASSDDRSFSDSRDV